MSSKTRPATNRGASSKYMCSDTNQDVSNHGQDMTAEGVSGGGAADAKSMCKLLTRHTPKATSTESTFSGVLESAAERNKGRRGGEEEE